jgi:polar amino acid transport system permease protein
VSSRGAIFDWAFALEILPELLRSVRVTLAAVAVGTLIALALGLVFAALRASRHAPARALGTLTVELIRSTPLLIQLYMLYFVLPSAGVTLPGLLTGMLGLGLHYGAYMAEVYRAGIEAVPQGQWEAARALGLSRRHTFTAIILPQALPRVIPALGNYVIAMFKDTPLLAAISVAELLRTAKVVGATHFRYLEPLTLVGLIFLALSLAAAYGVRVVEKRYVIPHA